MNDLDRILDLPRAREPDPETLRALELQLLRPGGSWLLRPLQLRALLELWVHGGLVGALGVGEGKTLISALAGRVTGASRPLLILPAHLRETARREFALYRNHFLIVEPQLLSYSELSRKDGAAKLAGLNPDLVILDECHYLRRPRSGRTRRFARWRAVNANVPVVAMSGTLTSKSIKDYAHLLLWALAEQAPAPVGYHLLDAWSATIDPYNTHRGTTAVDWKQTEPLVRWSTAGQERLAAGQKLWPFKGSDRRQMAREAWFERLKTAPGVITTSESTYQGSLEIGLLDPGVPQIITASLEALEASWCLPDGSPLISPLEIARARRQLSQGYYATFEWGDDGPDFEWLDRRSTWSGLCQWQIARAGHLGIDTPGTLTDAIEAGNPSIRPHVRDAYFAWLEVADRVDLDALRHVVWLDTTLVQFVAENLPRRGTLVWYSDVAVATALEAAGVPVCWPGDEPPADATSVALSLYSHGTGKNLQQYDQNFILNPPPDGQRWEQLLGRTHRPGQESDSVGVAVLAWTPIQRASVERAVRLAHYLQETTGQPQKLLKATALNFSLDRPT